MNSNLMTLPADLPENWKVNQIIAPSGREVGLSDQHGFNYLMKAVNDAHRACNRLKEDNERLRGELANKAGKDRPEIHEISFLPSYSKQPTHIATYCKTESSLVIVNLSVGHESGTFAPGIHTLAMLPVGFRPIVSTVVCPATSTSSDVPYMGFYADGSIKVSVVTAAYWIHASVVFPAA